MLAELNTQLWSKEKNRWSKKSIDLKFPTHFSMVSGCAVSLNNHQVLFVGGHHTMEYDQTIVELPWNQKLFGPIKMPINNQVIKFDFESNMWENITAVPLNTSEIIYGDLVSLNIKIEELVL